MNEGSVGGTARLEGASGAAGAVTRAAIPTPEELVARADALRPHLREQQAATEARGYPSKETHDKLKAAGFFKMYIPRKFGGYEFPLHCFQRVIISLAQGCPSTAWFTAFGAGHAISVASFYSERVQREVFGTEGNFQAPHAARGEQSSARPVEGGWIINGVWPYASGIPYATHFMGTAKILNADGTPAPDSPPRTVIAIVPADRFTMLEDWGDSLGMRGSGSNSVRVENAFIPTDYAIDWAEIDKTKPTPGTKLHGNPLYLGRIKPTYSGESQAVLVGTAKAALERFEEILKTRTLVRPGQMSDTLRYLDIGHQRNFGAAMVLVASAEALLIHSSEMYKEFGERWARDGIPFTDENEELLMHLGRQAGTIATNAMDLIFASTGTRAASDGEVIQRYFRDMSTIKSHGSSQFLDNVPLLARLHFGLTPPPRSPVGG